MSTTQPPPSPKYVDNCDRIEPAVGVAFAACCRLVTMKDLDEWLFMDLNTAWEFDYDHLAEHALSVGAQARYEENPNEPVGECVDYFLKAAAFLFYADALRQVENSKRSKPIELGELCKLVRRNLKAALGRPFKSWWKADYAKRCGEAKKRALASHKLAKPVGGKRK